MPATEDIIQRLKEERDKAFEESNAQTVYENLLQLRESHTIHRRRWIWELLQNAADATDPAKGNNCVSIHVEKNIIRFSHSGSAFNSREITHLLYHGSTKQGDDRKKGKFGTGFIAVHLVSPKVLIRGVLEENDIRKGFKFSLDRSGDTSPAIQQSMKAAWREFETSLSDTDGTEKFTTSFECELNPDAAVVVESGLADLERTVPYVLAFVDELEEVTVSRSDGRMTWRRVETKQPVSGTFTLTEIECLRSGGQPVHIRVAVVGNHVEDVALAVLLRQAGEEWEVIVDDLTPRLFYPLPLVDTHDLPVPFAIVSDKFEPVDGRNGIRAAAAGESATLTERNWTLLREVPSLFKTLIEACSNENWLAPHKLARFSQPTIKDWLDTKRLIAEVLVKIINFLQSVAAPSLVCVAEAKRIPIVEAIVPVKDPDGKIYALAGELNAVKDRLPMLEVARDWATILGEWAAVLGKNVEQLDEALTTEKLARRIAACKTLEELGASLTSGTGGGALVWINRLLGSVPTENLLAFVQSRAVLPNQQGQLKKSGELQLDDEIEEGIKDICDKLGASIRSQLLHKGICQPVSQLFEGEKGKSLSNENCVEWALKKVKEPSVEGKEETYAEANTQLVCWLIEHDQMQKLAGYPMLCAAGRGELRADKPLLVPVTLWDNGAQAFAVLFPADRRLHEKYTASLQDDHWRYLEKNKFVLRSFFVTEPLDALDQRQIVEKLLDDVEHKPATATMISQIAFLSGMLGEVRRSKPKAKLFLQFLLQYVIKANRQWIQGAEVACSCKNQHHVFPGWMFQVKTHEWVPVGRGKEDRPSAENIAALLDDKLKETILNDTDCAQFLLKIGIGVSELVRIGVPEEKRFQLDQLSARIYGSADESTMESIEAILDNPDIKEAALNKKHEIEKVARNQKVGKLVEELLRNELESAGIQVQRTGVGSDFELETDFVENEQEQLLKVSRYLLEVKSTSVPFVRMTLRQGEEAVKPQNRDNYLLCVVNVSGGIVNEQVVRDNARFVFGVGSMVETKVNDAKGLKDHEAELRPDGGGAVEIDINESNVKLRIRAEVWIDRGVSFQEFVEKMKGTVS
ncbi:MAG: ATP-binding protein [Verrucomicrobiota bacterium]|jgi:hypothetical protein